MADTRTYPWPFHCPSCYTSHVIAVTWPPGQTVVTLDFRCRVCDWHGTVTIDYISRSTAFEGKEATHEQEPT